MNMLLIIIDNKLFFFEIVTIYLYNLDCNKISPTCHKF